MFAVAHAPPHRWPPCSTRPQGPEPVHKWKNWADQQLSHTHRPPPDQRPAPRSRNDHSGIRPVHLGSAGSRPRALPRSRCAADTTDRFPATGSQRCTAAVSFGIPPHLRSPNYPVPLTAAGETRWNSRDLCAAQMKEPHVGSSGTSSNVDPSGAGLDAVLRSVLPTRTASLPPAYQRLPGALDPQGVQTAPGVQEGPRVLGTRCPPVLEALRPMGLDAGVLLIRIRSGRRLSRFVLWEPRGAIPLGPPDHQRPIR
jgi:hypothetical protein